MIRYNFWQILYKSKYILYNIKNLKYNYFHFIYFFSIYKNEKIFLLIENIYIIQAKPISIYL